MFVSFLKLGLISLFEPVYSSLSTIALPYWIFWMLLSIILLLIILIILSNKTLRKKIDFFFSALRRKIKKIKLKS
ncbi:MAG: hypothetical protein ACE5WD_09220, partial [Candidatus Aminicenantia bacterium]